ncbi:helix-turn-helix domain-containing protein [Saccharomonospora halophila]|uniref:helix-turn-helix domain-containing protein n=1 Tax=Saccharomonospora halophila TaxID=129922 RepID=UPI0018DCFFF5|nr:helix-turn-helix transcriptional regulator [Saccharomonospora halophila]
MAREPETVAEKRRALGAQLAASRQAADLTQGQLAKAAYCDRTTVTHIEKGRARADERFWRASDEAVGARGGLVAAFHDLVATKQAHERQEQEARLADARARAERLTSTSSSAAPASPVREDVAPVDGHAPSLRLDGAYVETLHSRIRELIDLDIQFGGDQSSGVALQLFRSVHRKLGASQCEPAIERDLYAAAGELGEVAGWLLYDAGKHDLVRRINHEALHLSRLAGDHSMELLILQNMSMHAGHLGRPSEALRIARMVLGTNTLSPRLEALFRTREARALALGGDDTAAERTFRQARSLYLDGVRDEDPAWAWWINDRELAWHEAVIQSDSADWCSATDTFHASIEVTPGREVRRRYNHLASLLDAQIRVGAWRDVDQTIERVMPYVDEVGSTRTATTLLGAVDQLGTVRATPSVREGATQLRDLLTEAGYSR